MEKVEQFIKIIKEMLGFIREDGAFTVIVVAILLILGFSLFVIKDIFSKRIIISIFSIIVLIAFSLFAMQFTNEKLLKQDKVVRSTPKTNISKLENKENKILSENPREDKQNSSEKIESEKISNEEDISYSLENTVLDFIENMNQRTEKGYNNSYNFIERYLPKSMTKENYVGYWNNNKAQFILSDINELNHSFSVIIDFDESSAVDLFNTYKVLEDNYKWYIEDKTQKKLQNFDKWKINGNQRLKYSNKKNFNGECYSKKPTTKSSECQEKELQVENTIAYTETEEGKFYLTRYSLNKLIEDRPEFCNWIHEIK